MSLSLSIAGLTYTELVGSEEITYDQQEPRIRRRLLCDWGDAPAICEAFLGYVARAGIASLVYTAPQRHPNPKYNFLFARRAHVTGLGIPTQDALGVIAYTKGLIELDYELPSSTSGDQPEITYVSERRDLSAEFMTIPGSKLVFAQADTQGAHAGTVAVGEGIRAAKIIPTTRISIDIHFWIGATDKIRTGLFDSACGMVNGWPFIFVDALYGAETLLFNGASFVRQWTSTGIAAWQVTLEFTHKRIGWNRSFRGALGTQPDGFWTSCMMDSSRIYPRIDFRELGPGDNTRRYGFIQAPRPPRFFNPFTDF